MGREDPQQRFAEFVHTHWAQLMRVAVAVSGSRVDAEDLVQSVLTRAYPRWDKIDPDRALAYLRRSIVNTDVSWWRRHRGAELTMIDAIDKPTPDWSATVDERLAALSF